MFLPNLFASVYNLAMQLLTVMLPMIFTGAYSMFCWLLAEPFVMPIWDHIFKPIYQSVLQGLQNIGYACAKKWGEFWNFNNSTPAPNNETRQYNYKERHKPRLSLKSICPLLFRKQNKTASKVSAFSSKATESYPKQAPAQLPGLAV